MVKRKQNVNENQKRKLEKNKYKLLNYNLYLIGR